MQNCSTTTSSTRVQVAHALHVRLLRCLPIAKVPRYAMHIDY